MDDIKQKRLSILAEIDRENTKRCNRCSPGYSYTRNCCPASIRVEELGKELLKIKGKDVHDKTYREQYVFWRNIAERNGIPKNTFGKRIRDHGYSFERAATQPVIKKTEIYTDEQLKLIEQAKANGISRQTFIRRMDAGWSLAEALSKPSNRGDRLEV